MERPDGEQGTALLAAPARKVTVGYDVIEDAWAVGSTRNVDILATPGHSARLLQLWVLLPKASETPTTGRVEMTIYCAGVMIGQAAFGYAQWGTGSASRIGFFFGSPMAGQFGFAMSPPSVFMLPATSQEWRDLMAQIRWSGDYSLRVSVRNGTNKAGDLYDTQETTWLLEEEAIL